MADKDMSSPSSSMIQSALGVALPVDASLNDSLGLESVQSQVRANFGPSGASDGDELVWDLAPHALRHYIPSSFVGGEHFVCSVFVQVMRGPILTQDCRIVPGFVVNILA